MSYEEKVYTKLKQHYHCAQAILPRMLRIMVWIRKRHIARWHVLQRECIGEVCVVVLRRHLLYWGWPMVFRYKR